LIAIISASLKPVLRHQESGVYTASTLKWVFIKLSLVHFWGICSRCAQSL